MRHRVLGLVSVVTVLAPVAAAHATVTVSPKGIRSPQVALNAAKRTAVAWERWTGHRFTVEARVGPRWSRLGRVQRFGASGFQPRVAVGADGTAAVAWWAEAKPARTRELRVATARPGHAFGRSRLVTRRRANLSLAGVAVQHDGRVVVVWVRNRSTLEFAAARAGHGLSDPRVIGRRSDGPPVSLVVDPRDGAVVLTYGAAAPFGTRAAASTLPLGATRFTPPVIVSRTDPDPAKEGAASPQAIVGPAGAGIAYALTVHEPGALEVTLRGSDGSWQPPRRVAEVEAFDAHFPSGLVATLPADGAILAAWSADTFQTGEGGGLISRQVLTSVAPPSQPFGAPIAFTRPARRTSEPSVASAGPNAFVAIAGNGRIRVAKRVRGGSAVQPPRTLVRSGADGDVLLAAGGRYVLAAYQQGDRLRIAAIG